MLYVVQVSAYGRSSDARAHVLKPDADSALERSPCPTLTVECAGCHDYGTRGLRVFLPDGFREANEYDSAGTSECPYSKDPIP